MAPTWLIRVSRLTVWVVWGCEGGAVPLGACKKIVIIFDPQLFFSFLLSIFRSIWPRILAIRSAMADPHSITAPIFALLTKLVEESAKSQSTYYAVSLSQGRESERKLRIDLETSRKKFQVWRETWIKNVSDTTISADELWGAGGWKDIQKLLGTVRDTTLKIESELARRDDGLTRFKWPRAWRGSLTKKSQTLIVKSPPLLVLTIQLSRSIDELWTYSEGSFDSLHGIFAHQFGLPQREKLLARSLLTRTGSLALYGACSQSEADYSLELDLLGDKVETRNVFHRRSSVSSIMPSRLCYHLFAQDRGVPEKIEEITIESMPQFGEQDSMNTAVVDFDIKKSDLATYESWPSLKPGGLISIQPHTAYAPSYFRIPGPPTVADSNCQSESLVHLLYKERIGSAPQLAPPLTQEAKVGLAFKVVECGLYLLGTPWLASLNSKRLRRMETQKRTSFVLEVQTLDIEDLYFEDPSALSEYTQLFSIGLVLAEIALSDETNSASFHDPELRKSKILPLVERSMGSLYSGATAFCLQERRSAPNFERPEKYKYPEETGWTSFLTELLEDYHAQVFSR